MDDNQKYSLENPEYYGELKLVEYGITKNRMLQEIDNIRAKRSTLTLSAQWSLADFYNRYFSHIYGELKI
jgi:hypothetical protein